MNLYNFLWWTIFIICGIWAQYFVRGVDFLMIGLVLSLQEGRPAQTAWLLAIFVLIQEGIGSLSFGSSLLWYAMLVVLYSLGRWLFQAKNMIFMVLMGACMGVWHYLLIFIMSSLQDAVVSHDRLFFESVLQALLFPIGWAVANALRSRRESDALSV